MLWGGARSGIGAEGCATRALLRGSWEKVRASVPLLGRGWDAAACRRDLGVGEEGEAALALLLRAWAKV